MLRITKRICIGWVVGCLLLPVAGAWGMDAQECAECHLDTSIIEDGGRYLYIDPVQYERTAHSEEGCTACHISVSDGHPEDGIRPSRALCNSCHDDVSEEYAACDHGANADCTDCHNPHQVKSINAVSGFDMNRMCIECHDPKDVTGTHSVWLPQAQLHIEALPCITCHTGSENYVITFYIEKFEKRSGTITNVKLASFEELNAIDPSGKVEHLIDSNADGTINISELKAFNISSRKKDLRLKGMMTPEDASHTYSTLDNRWDCTFCHASGPTAMQKSFVAFPNGQGTYSQITVESGAVLDALYGTPDFYMVGATRNDMLSVVGLLIVGAGLLLPIGHGSLRLLTMKNRKEEEE